MKVDPSASLLLAVAGGVLLVGGLVAALVAVFIANTGARTLVSAKSSALTLAFPTPDYSAFWVGIIAAAVGLLLLATGIVASVRRRAAA